jgi:hypothetical protein
MFDQNARSRRGITVLGLLLLIIALVLVAIYAVRYLRTGAVTHTTPVTSLRSRLPHQTLDQLNLPGVIEVVRGDAVDFLGQGPHTLGG